MLTFDTALGTCGITWSDVGITGVLLPGTRGLTRRAAASPPAVPDAIHGTVAAIVALLDGEHTDLRESCSTRPGSTRSGAASMPRPARSRRGRRPATATSPARSESPTLRARSATRWARTPIPIVVPCHRVLSSAGALHGFSAPGGIATKRRMLEIERAPGFTQLSLLQRLTAG